MAQSSVPLSVDGSGSSTATFGEVHVFAAAPNMNVGPEETSAAESGAEVHMRGSRQRPKIISPGSKSQASGGSGTGSRSPVRVPPRHGSASPTAAGQRVRDEQRVRGRSQQGNQQPDGAARSSTARLGQAEGSVFGYASARPEQAVSGYDRAVATPRASDSVGTGGRRQPNGMSPTPSHRHGEGNPTSRDRSHFGSPYTPTLGDGSSPSFAPTRLDTPSSPSRVEGSPSMVSTVPYGAVSPSGEYVPSAGASPAGIAPPAGALGSASLHGAGTADPRFRASFDSSGAASRRAASNSKRAIEDSQSPQGQVRQRVAEPPNAGSGREALSPLSFASYQQEDHEMELRKVHIPLPRIQLEPRITISMPMQAYENLLNSLSNEVARARKAGKDEAIEAMELAVHKLKDMVVQMFYEGQGLQTQNASLHDTLATDRNRVDQWMEEQLNRFREHSQQWVSNYQNQLAAKYQDELEALRRKYNSECDSMRQHYHQLER